MNTLEEVQTYCNDQDLCGLNPRYYTRNNTFFLETSNDYNKLSPDVKKLLVLQPVFEAQSQSGAGRRRKSTRRKSTRRKSTRRKSTRRKRTKRIRRR